MPTPAGNGVRGSLAGGGAMQARCRRSVVWVVPFLMVALAGWAGARSAAAADLQSTLEAPCAQSVEVAAFAAPEWAAQETGTMGTEAPPMAMGTEAPPATGTAEIGRAHV